MKNPRNDTPVTETENLDALVLDTGPEPEVTVIWLHGLGASGHDFEPVVPEMTLGRQQPVRFIFPHAPERPVTVNGGMVMPAWYDILSMDIDRKVDEAQLRESAAQVRALVEQERARGVDSRRILLGGFSQGGAVAYELALSYPEPLAGLFALSTYYATAETVNRSPANQSLPIFIGHGRFDPMVHESLGQAARDRLLDQGYQPDYQTYPMDHSLCLEEVRALDRFLAQCLAREPSHSSSDPG